jgi:hypothetical protein
MGGINEYLNSIKKQYPETREVNEQIEELRDTLHLKTEEYQAMGRSYNEAVAAAISSMGDVGPLFDQVSGNMRNVYVARLNRDISRLSMLTVFAAYLIGWLGFLLTVNAQGSMFQGPFFILGLMLAIAIAIWPTVMHVIYKRQPDKTDIVKFPYKKRMRVALFVWITISAVFFIINASTLNWYGGEKIIWFIWPVLVLGVWPATLWLYRRMLAGGRYDAA